MADDGSYAYVASYNDLSGNGPFTNWVWRSADDGQTWSIIRTTSAYRHAHSIQANPDTGDLYLLWGDEDVAAIERSHDHGETWETVCSTINCLAVDIAFGPGNIAVFGKDAPDQAGTIERLDLVTGQRTTVTSMAGTSFSAFRHQGVFLIGNTHEPQGNYPANDPNVHLYASDDNGQTFSDVFQFPWQYPNGYIELKVQFAYPSGNFPIQVIGYGTIVARLTGGTPPPTVPVNSVPPAISGTAQVGQSLSSSSGTWSGSPSSYAYQWSRCNSAGASCVDLGGATDPSYLLVAADEGATLRVQVTASNATGPGVAVTSDPSGIVAAPPLAVPVNSVPPAISGTAQVGQSLSGSSGTWSGSPSSYAYQWSRCNSAGASCVDLGGATNPSYLLVAADEGATLRVQVTAANATGPGVAVTSDPSGIVAAPPLAVPVNSVLPAISGTAQVGQSLSASSGTWSGSPSSYAYQWSRCNSAGRRVLIWVAPRTRRICWSQQTRERLSGCR